jgi:ABC-type multidrug transport system fused ATPase/permease subunit
MLILDEPTANLDAMAANEILRTLFSLMRGRSILWITHRLAGLEGADDILVMIGGTIVEHGSHHQLLKTGGPYCRLWRFQNRLQEAAIGALARPS